MSKIKWIKASQILDSRGKPTIKVKIELESGIKAEASVPSGASTGSREALEMRDHVKGIDRKSEDYDGYGVKKAVENVNNEIAPDLIGFIKKNKLDVKDQDKIDQFMIALDGTPNKSRLGANAILGVSLACARVAALENDIPLYDYIAQQDKAVCKKYNRKYDEKELSVRRMPCPMANVINGGSHAENNVDMQEYMVAPYGAKDFHEAIHMVFKVFWRLKEALHRDGHSTGVGDEGGFAPNLSSNEEPLKYILEAITEAKYKAGEQVFITMDPASSEFYNQKEHRFGNRYSLSDQEDLITSEKMIKLYAQLLEDYPEIFSIEDGLAESDWAGWMEMNKQLGKKIQLVGDDLFVTNKVILERGIKEGSANAILIKLNQIGTLTETLETIAYARENGYNIVISHRSGETCDPFIADLAVGVNSGQIKTGSICRSERICKFNRLLEIEDELTDKFGKKPPFGIY
ncbi:MAG: phosphopyruvate hydratase [Candidatus Cloacimonetes bacterium]|nr:phosphopyruvate hydratase [Candidatus Cloacimonadota bacterium]